MLSPSYFYFTRLQIYLYGLPNEKETDGVVDTMKNLESSDRESSTILCWICWNFSRPPFDSPQKLLTGYDARNQ